MKKLIAIIMFCGPAALAQSFTAETGYVNVGESNTEFYGDMQVLSGTLKDTDKIDIYAETGRKFTAVITKMKNEGRTPIHSAKAGEFVLVDFKTTEDATKGGDYLRKGYKVYPAGFKPDNQPQAATKESQKNVLTATVDRKLFRARAGYKGASLFRKGVKDYIEKPYLQLQFTAALSPDTRTLTIQIINPKEGPAQYNVTDMEVNFSGAVDGNKTHTTLYGFVNGKGDTDFQLSITQWQTIGNKAIISGKLSGKLKEVKLLGVAKNYSAFENGTFDDVEVELINEPLELKKMMKEGGWKF